MLRKESKKTTTNAQGNQPMDNLKEEKSFHSSIPMNTAVHGLLLAFHSNKEAAFGGGVGGC